jgi:hypothetical protein
MWDVTRNKGDFAGTSWINVLLLSYHLSVTETPPALQHIVIFFAMKVQSPFILNKLDRLVQCVGKYFSICISSYFKCNDPCHLGIAAVKNIDAPIYTCVWKELEYRIDMWSVTVVHTSNISSCQRNFFSFPVAVNSSIKEGPLVFLLYIFVITENIMKRTVFLQNNRIRIEHEVDSCY